MTSRPRALGGFIPPMPAPGVGYGVRVLGLSPFTTEWYVANAAVVNSVAGKSGTVTLVHTDISDWASTLLPYAPLNSPLFTGAPAAPTPAAADNSTTLATTAFVKTAISGSVAGVASFNTRTGVVTLSNADVIAVLAPGTGSPAMDGAASAGASGNWARFDHVHPSDTSRVPFSGGVMTGLLVLSADPAVPLGAATKQYVDNVGLDMGTY